MLFLEWTNTNVVVVVVVVNFGLSLRGEGSEVWTFVWLHMRLHRTHRHCQAGPFKQCCWWAEFNNKERFRSRFRFNWYGNNMWTQVCDSAYWNTVRVNCFITTRSQAVLLFHEDELRNITYLLLLPGIEFVASRRESFNILNVMKPNSKRYSRNEQSQL